MLARRVLRDRGVLRVPISYSADSGRDWCVVTPDPWHPSTLAAPQDGHALGSCSAAGRMLLNPELVRAPRSCIEYTLAPERGHVRELNHTMRFYRMAALLPDWKVRRSGWMGGGRSSTSQ